MIFSTSTILLGLVSLTSVVSASPARLSKRENSCWHGDQGLNRVWTVYIDDDAKYDKGGCGAGFLDNFRGRCGEIDGWSCTLFGDQAQISFVTGVGCTDYDISQAILAASYGDLNVACTAR